ncbi:MAG: hypothetical protein KJ950_07305 [Proteobacteria bacterium]|nr:hypothetical protein [Pseudomonadota bacterium]MBU1687052.1 hypothetical protein [Pseudomonadota bacterium]
MKKKDLVEKNPLKMFVQDKDGNPVNQRMSLLMSRAGLGKTAILVQIALDSILRGNKVLHVSVGQSLDKTRAWYDDILHDIVGAMGLEDGAEVKEQVMRNRLIMTFKEAEFNRPKLEERLNDLVYQNVFRPDCLIVDGFDFEQTERQGLVEMRELVDAMELQVWFSALLHREDHRESSSGVPAPCHEVDDLFDTVVLIQPQGEKPNLCLKVVKDNGGQAGKILALDPVTYLVKEA